MTARKTKVEATKAVFNTPPTATLDDVDAQRQYADQKTLPPASDLGIPLPPAGLR